MPDKNKRLTVDMGNISMKVKTNELAVLDENYKELNKNAIPGTSFNKFELRRLSMSQELDLRGQVDAVALLDGVVHGVHQHDDIHR